MIHHVFAFVALMCPAWSATSAQIPPAPRGSNPDSTVLDSSAKAEVAEAFAKLLTDRYAYADKGAAAAGIIRDRLRSGAYERISSPREFAEALQADARSVTRDLHLRISFSSGGPMRIIRRGRPSPEMIAQMRKRNADIPELKILDGNIGYLPVNGMLPAQASDEAIAAAFAFLHNTDALIIDLRANPGGSGYAEVYLSYLSEGAPCVTGEVHWRDGNRVQRFKTTDMGAASYGANKPVYVLTSHVTFSAAEGLAYAIQALRRGTIVGETTGGGANPSDAAGSAQLGHGLSANIPTGYVVNAVTGTNWEGIGIKPDVRVPPEQALTKAWSLAADRLQRSAEDPMTRDSLEALSLAKLDGPPSFTPAELAGSYDMPGRRMMLGLMTSNLTFIENKGALLEQTRDGTLPLQSVGGDRYRIAGASAGFSLIFFRRNGAVRVLESGGMTAWVLEKEGGK